MTAAPAIKGWCPTLLSPMQSGDGWLARVKPSAGCVSADAARLIADAATPPRQRSYRPHLARQFADQGTQSSLGASLRRDHHRRGPRQRQPVTRSRSQCHGEPAWARRSFCILRLACCCARHRSDARRRARALGAAVEIRHPRRWRRGAAAGRHQRRHYGSTGRGRAYRPPRWRYTRCALRSVLARRNGEGSGARFPTPVRATKREAPRACARW